MNVWHIIILSALDENGSFSRLSDLPTFYEDSPGQFDHHLKKLIDLNLTNCRFVDWTLKWQDWQQKNWDRAIR